MQAIAGMAVLAGAVLAFQQLTQDRQQATATRELTVQGQASERFTRAIDQLGSDRREVQLGGIYGLEQIGQQAPDNRLAVTEVLVAYLHRRAPALAKTPPNPQLAEELRVRAPDVHAALTVLGRRQVESTDPPLDLRALDLRRAELSNTNFRGADLRDSLLNNADLSHANLYGANLRGAFISDANFRDANLNGTDLYDTDLSGASLRGADLRRALLSVADLDSTDFSDADLRDALLIKANLSNARLVNANLSSARLIDAVVSGADLSEANLSDANLIGANLSDAYLGNATADRNTKWPLGFDWQSAGVRSEAGAGS